MNVNLNSCIKWAIPVPILMASVQLSLAQQRTTATYDDWTVSCVQKKCEMISLQQSKAQPSLAIQITIESLAKEKLFKMSIQVPASVWLSNGIKVSADDKSPGVVATFRWCIPGRCLADAEVKQEEIKKLCDRSWQLTFQDAQRTDLNLPVSFKGLCPAFENVLASKVTSAN